MSRGEREEEMKRKKGRLEMKIGPLGQLDLCLCLQYSTFMCLGWLVYGLGLLLYMRNDYIFDVLEAQL